MTIDPKLREQWDAENKAMAEKAKKVRDKIQQSLDQITDPAMKEHLIKELTKGCGK